MPSVASPSRFLIRCDLRLHKVALDPARYWRPMACPVCQRSLDKWRFRRAKLWLTGHAPRSGLRFGRAFRIVPIEGLALLWGLLLLAVTVLLHTVADDWWPATVLLFLGRWPWVVIGLPIVIAALIVRSKRAILFSAAALLLGMVGVMEFSFGLGRFSGTSDPASRMRVITFNMDGDVAAPLIPDLIMGWQPDVLAIQECGETVRDLLTRMTGYHADVGTTCLVTRYPIVSMDSLRRDRFMDAGGAAWVKRYRLKGPTGEFDFTNVHLDTPRKAFESMMKGDDDAPAIVDDKTAVRDLESRLARRWVDLGRGPRLVAGDFNMPSESAIFRRHWSGMTDGFDHAGFGFGSSRLAGWIRLRIDHVLADDGWVVKSAKILPDYGSDHLPVMVEVERATR